MTVETLAEAPVLATKESVKPEENYRQPPHNIAAEQTVLGAILTNNRALDKIGDFLEAGHFFEPVHKRIFEAILGFNERELVANPVTLKNRFDNDEALKELGGAAYLSQLAGMASGIIDIRDFARIVYNMAISRELIGIGEDMVNEAYQNDGKEQGSEQIERFEQQLFTLATEGASEGNFTPFNHSLTEAIENATRAAENQGNISGIPTRLRDLDTLLGGLHNSDLVILAARPSMGKTALALNIASNAAKILKEEAELPENKQNPEFKMGSVGVMSLEMSAEQLATRMLSIETGINAGDIRRGKLSPTARSRGEKSDFQKLIEANKELYELPIYTDDTPALSISAVRTRARRLKRKYNLSLLVIDYLQLLRGVGKHSESSRVQEISEITMGLKAIAKELNIPVLALSQLSRAVESREDKRPQLSDLRESGSIEQDADMVMFIYREAYYVERKKPEEGTEKFTQWLQDMDRCHNTADVMVAKNRNGPIGNVRLFFDQTTTRFSDLDTHHIVET